MHLREVSRLAGHFGEAFNAGALCAHAGLFHDLGKYSAAFQARLHGSTVTVDHSTAGAAIVNKRAAATDRFAAELIGYAIAGHHAGLPDRRGTTGSSLTERLARFDEGTLDPVWQQELPGPVGPLMPGLAWVTDDRERFAFQFALLGRMVFSALVDADFKATEAFYTRAGAYQPDRDWPALAERLDELIARLDARLAAFGQPRDRVGRMRQEVLAKVRSKAGETPGLFTLTVPTGGGKTLTSLAFALEHARRHGKRRIIYALPFTGAWIETRRSVSYRLSRAHGNRLVKQPEITAGALAIIYGRRLPDLYRALGGYLSDEDRYGDEEGEF
jgi:CRISPR-associated endonuclease/helicase Cas3